MSNNEKWHIKALQYRFIFPVIEKAHLLTET